MGYRTSAAAWPARGLVRAFGLVALLWTLSGCAVTHGPRDPAKASAAADEGVAIVSVTLNTSQVNAFDSIVLEQVGASGGSGSSHFRHLHNAVPGLARDTSLFVGLLKTGEYRLASLRDSTTQRFLLLDEAQRSLLGSFRIEPGRTTDLGRLILTAANLKVLLGRSERVQSNAELSRFAPEYARWLRTPNPLGWSSPRSEKDIAEAFARHRPQGTTGFSEMPTGEVLAGTRMGLILQRSPEGRWRILAETGKPEAILWTMPYATHESMAVAVGELGTFMLVGADGRLKPVDTGDLPPGNLFFVDRSSVTGEWIVGLRLGGSAQIYRSDALESRKWTLMRLDTVAPSLWSGARHAWLWTRPGGVGYAATDRPVVACYDYVQRRWTEQPTPAGRSAIGVGVSRDHPAMGILTSPGGGFGGVFAQTHFTEDCGAVWHAVDSPYSVKMTAPVMLPSGTLLEAGGAFRDEGIYASTDRGKTWVKRADGGQANEWLYSLPTKGLFSVTRGALGFEVLSHSSDEGATWTVELSSFERRLFEGPPK